MSKTLLTAQRTRQDEDLGLGELIGENHTRLVVSCAHPAPCFRQSSSPHSSRTSLTPVPRGWLNTLTSSLALTSPESLPSVNPEILISHWTPA